MLINEFGNIILGNYELDYENNKITHINIDFPYIGNIGQLFVNNNLYITPIRRDGDIVFEYNASESYPKHTLLIEATLADKNNQRRMEMEPVSRHLGDHLIATNNLDSYCVFATNNLNPNVVSDFRQRKDSVYYDPRNIMNSVKGMKIIPLETSDLRTIIRNRKRYTELYKTFELAYRNDIIHDPIEWWINCVRMSLSAV